MSGYGTFKWTCGECGDTYQADGVVGDLKVNSWVREHKEQHRIEKLSPADREMHDGLAWRSLVRSGLDPAA